MKNKFLIVTILLLTACSKFDPELNENINLGINKEVKITASNDTKMNFYTDLSDTKTLYKFNYESSYITDFNNNIQLILKSVNVGTFKMKNNKLWVYFNETSSFYNEGWYYYDERSGSFIRAIKKYFDTDLVDELTPKYNKKDYYYFKLENFNNLNLYNFDKLVYSWVENIFKNEISDTDIFSISYNEKVNEIWFALNNNLKMFDMKNRFWFEPLVNRVSDEFLDELQIREIKVLENYVVILPNNKNVMIYDKNRDMWIEFNNENIVELEFVTEDNNYIWFESSENIYQFNKKNNQWETFDEIKYYLSRTDEIQIKNVFVNEINNFWFDVNNTLIYFDNNKKEFKILKKNNFPLKNRNGVNYIESISEIKWDDKVIWISTECGFLVYNIKTQKWNIYDKNDMNDYFGIEFDNFGHLYIQDNYVWIGTDNGLFRIKK